MNSEESAFEQLLNAYEGKVVRLCYAILGDRALAEDTAQEVFLRIWRSLGAFRGEASLSTWIYSITRNACFTSAQRMKSSMAESLTDPEVARRVETRKLESMRTAPQPDVLAWLTQLPKSQRQAMTLFYLEDKSYVEVALALGVPMGTVKTWIHRGRRALVEKRLQAESLERVRAG